MSFLFLKVRIMKVDSRPRPTAVPRPTTTAQPEVEIVTAVQNLIREGELSQEDVIEEMINQGILPVDVTDLGCLLLNETLYLVLCTSTRLGNVRSLRLD